MTRHASAEELLREYLTAADEREAERRLEEILEDLARPLVKRIAMSVIRGSDAEDVVADTILDLLRKLRELRGDASHPIHDLRRYIATCAYNRCHERLRERYPARNRLRNQLRYLCTHDRGLALWRDADGAMVCGFREWLGREAAGADWLQSAPAIARSDPGGENRAQIAALALQLLRHAGAPVPLDVLSSTIARVIGADRIAEVALTELETAPDLGQDEALDHRMSLRQLWDDVRRLAPKQRVALLLNLRDVRGRECLTLLPLTRTATIPEIAEAVDIPPDEFAKLWNRLPLSDAAIGDLLEATPRQVIKLRRLARERLRRMAVARSRTHRNIRLDLHSSSNGTTIPTRR